MPYQIIVLKGQAHMSSKDTNPTFTLNYEMREGNADCNLISIIQSMSQLHLKIRIQMEEELESDQESGSVF